MDPAERKEPAAKISHHAQRSSVWMRGLLSESCSRQLHRTSATVSERVMDLGAMLHAAIVRGRLVAPNGRSRGPAPPAGFWLKVVAVL